MCPGKARSCLQLRQTLDARSSLPAHPRAPAVRRSIHPWRRHQRRQPLASRAAGSRSNHADEPVDVSLRVIQVRGYANVAFSQAYDNIFLPQVLVDLGGFLLASRRKTSVRAAPRGVLRARNHKAILGETLEYQ